jgi:hypothetical protein
MDAALLDEFHEAETEHEFGRGGITTPQEMVGRLSSKTEGSGVGR